MFVVVYYLQVQLDAVDGEVDVDVPLHTHLCDLVEPGRLAVDTEPKVTYGFRQHIYTFLVGVDASEVLKVLDNANKRGGAAIVELICRRLGLIVLLNLFSCLFCLISELCLCATKEKHGVPFYSGLVPNLSHRQRCQGTGANFRLEVEGLTEKLVGLVVIILWLELPFLLAFLDPLVVCLEIYVVELFKEIAC